MRKLFFALMAITLVSCNFHDQRKKDAIEALKKADQALINTPSDTATVKQARKAVELFVGRFPEDSLSPALLFQLGIVYEKHRQYDSAIKILDRVYSFYPRSKDASKAVFYQGFIYSDHLKIYDLAKEKYQLYLDKYSSVDAKMTNDAKLEIEHLGKSPDERLKEILEKKTKDSINAVMNQ